MCFYISGLNLSSRELKIPDNPDKIQFCRKYSILRGFMDMSSATPTEIFGKLKAMEHYASPPSSLIWLWLFVSFGEPLVTFVTALSEGRSDHRKEHSFRCSIIVHYSRYFTTSVSGVEGFILLLSGFGGRYSVLGHSCHSLWGCCDHRRSWRWSG